MYVVIADADKDRIVLKFVTIALLQATWHYSTENGRLTLASSLIDYTFYFIA
jgi:hypothetical protein